MRYTRTLLATAAISAILGLTACGGGSDGDGPPPTYTTQIFSDSSYDGDIEAAGQNQFTITQGMSASVQSVLAGIDPVGGTEFRAFLDFPLGGSSGVPANAGIDSASLEFFVDDLQPDTASLPLLIELVDIRALNLAPTDYDRAAQPPLASVRVSPPINHADIGNSVVVDVTSLMIQAQRLGLPEFQVRIMEDLVPTPVEALMAIDDTTGPDRPKFAPLLTVNYF
jgi:hypothetical protein